MEQREEIKILDRMKRLWYLFWVTFDPYYKIFLSGRITISLSIFDIYLFDKIISLKSYSRSFALFFILYIKYHRSCAKSKHLLEAVIQKCSVKRVSLEISQNSLEISLLCSKCFVQDYLPGEILHITIPILLRYSPIWSFL